MVGNRTSAFVFVASVITVTALTWVTTATWVHGQAGGAANCQPGTAPSYDPVTHNLCTPVGFETWVFVGSNLGLSYKENHPTMTAEEKTRAEIQQFHNVYINPEAYAHFAAAGEFPDRTVLVMEVFDAANKDPGGVLATGVFNGERAGLEVAVKNLRRPDGSTTPWAYYILDPADPHATAKARPDSKCEACHAVNASKDHVWVQFYPTLRKLGK
jgi:hypothetical protein